MKNAHHKKRQRNMTKRTRLFMIRSNSTYRYNHKAGNRVRSKIGTYRACARVRAASMHVCTQ